MNVRKLPVAVTDRAIFKDQMYDILQRLGYGESIDDFVVEWNEFTRKLTSKHELEGITVPLKDRLLHHITDKSKPLALWDFVSEKFKFYVAEVEAYLADKKAKKLEDEVVALKAKVAELEAKLQEEAAKPKEPAEPVPFNRNLAAHVFIKEKIDILKPDAVVELLEIWFDVLPEAIYNLWREPWEIGKNNVLLSPWFLMTDAAKVHVLEARVKKDREVIDHLVKELEKQQKQTTDNINALKRVYRKE